MYNDYPIVYETNLHENMIYFVILGVILLSIIVFVLISLSKIFKKANRRGISAFIPIYNIFTLIDIVNLPNSYFILLLIPFVNLIFIYRMYYLLAKMFKKDKLFALGMLLLPFIFYPILAFNSSEYIGINLSALEGKTLVAELPKVEENIEDNKVIHDEVDTSSKNINISIGGGKYQKDYSNDLIGVDQNQKINNDKNVDESVNLVNNTNTFINNNEVEEPVKNDGIQIFSDNQSDKNTQMTDLTNSYNNLNLVTNNSNTQNDSTNQSTSAVVICPHCGTTLTENSKICFLCGENIDE